MEQYRMLYQSWSLYYDDTYTQLLSVVNANVHATATVKAANTNASIAANAKAANANTNAIAAYINANANTNGLRSTPYMMYVLYCIVAYNDVCSILHSRI